jgi:hypothetical protein
MPKDQDLEVLRPVVIASTDQQARERSTMRDRRNSIAGW